MDVDRDTRSGSYQSSTGMSYITPEGNATISQGWSEATQHQKAIDATLQGPFELFGNSHELIVGANYLDYVNHHYATTGRSAIVDFNHWNNELPKPDKDGFTPALDYDVDTRQSGYFVAGRFNLSDSLHLILGARASNYRYHYYSKSLASGYVMDYSMTERGEVTPYAGVVYDLTPEQSIYVSYTDIFKPQSELDAAGAAIEPMEGKNYELGIKGEYFDGSLNASAAVFRIDQQNRAKTLELDECSALVPSCAEAAGKLRSEGIELELNGTVLPGWELGAGYTFAQVKYVKDSNPANEGRLFDTDIPRHVFKAFTTYQLPGELQRWKVGGGLYRQNQIYNKGNNFYATESRYRIEQEAYTLVDLMLNYQASEHLDVRLNLNNVFDKKYYQSIAGNTGYGGNLYGDPRNFMLTTRWSF